MATAGAVRRGWRLTAATPVVIAALAMLGPSARAPAQTIDLLLAPKTWVDRAIEARSMADIARDNQIVIKVNMLMAEIGTIKASTRIYEQRLLVTGLFDDKSDYDRFEKGVRAIKEVKRLYWHVTYMPQEEQSRRKLLAWSDVLVLETKAEARLIGASGVADVNFRTAVDAFGTLYLLGRARSNQERSKARARARESDGVKKLVDYVDVRP